MDELIFRCAVSSMLIFIGMLFIEYRSRGMNLNNSMDPVDAVVDLDSFRDNIERLKALFPMQTMYLWKLIGSASIDFFESENPKRPAVILLAGSRGSQSTLQYMASELSKSYTRKFSIIEIDGRQYRETDPYMAKKKLDETLISGFRTGSKVAVIYHFESIPAEASLIFHSYCENDNAPFKKVVIIFTVEVTEELNPKDGLKLNQKKVEQHLENQWKNDVDKDHIEAMFSRVATATAFVTPE